MQELVPHYVKNERAMMEFRYFYIANFVVPGAIENINPNNFLRLKPIEEFDLLPLIPISASRMKRF
jgi:hypothetical protein